MARALRPVGHDDRLSLIEHLDELRTRLIVSAIAITITFSVCLWQNHALLDLINRPLEKTTQHAIEKGRGPVGQAALAQQAVRVLAREEQVLLTTLEQPGVKLSAVARAELRASATRIRAAIAKLPKPIPGNRPVTLGVAEPFSATLGVAFYFSLLFAMPLVLYQLYAFLLPAFSPRERKVALPLMLMVPCLFIAGVVFGYLLVLPPAIKFLQNFNGDSFNVLVQARDYYRFATLTLLSLGFVFQMPVAILAATRVGIVSIAQLRGNRRYAIVVCAVIAMLLPGTDPVSMLLEMVPLVVLYELSILLASWLGRPGSRAASDPTIDTEHSSIDAV